MKLTSKPTQIQTSANFTELEFGIKSQDMGLVLEILRSKMYRNPIGAICREVASNSRDANREAENNVPIEISICDSKLLASDTTIAFKDNGTGISPDRMADVFVNYGASTKRDTDIYTGGFGLGAKTPFSYADNFSIETIFDGVKYIYIAAIEEGRRGKIYLIDSQATEEPNGTTIIVPMKSQDRETFEWECMKATMFWPLKPIYKNFRTRIPQMDLIYENELLAIYSQSKIISPYGLLLDGILYEIDRNIIPKAAGYLSNMLIIYKFNVGDLTISANRESLQYDKQTIDKINEKFEVLINTCKTQLEAFKTSIKSWWEFAIFRTVSSENNFIRILENFENESSAFWKAYWEFDKHPVKLNLESLFPSLIFQKIEMNRRIDRTKTTQISKNFKTAKIYLLDHVGYFSTAKDELILKIENFFYGIKPLNPEFLKWDRLNFKERKAIAKQMRRFLNDIELLKTLKVPVIPYSSIEIKKTARTTTSSGGSTRERMVGELKVNKFDLVNGTNKSERYTHIKIDEDKVTLNNADIVNNDAWVYCLVDDIMVVDDMLSKMEIRTLKYAMKLNLIPKASILFVNKNRGKVLEGLVTHLDTKLALLTPDIITKIIDHDMLYEIKESFSKWSKFTYQSKKFSEIMKQLSTITAASSKIYVGNDIISHYKKLSQIPVISSNDFGKTFPLVSYISDYDFRNSNATLKDVQNYITLMETDLIKNKQLI